MKLEKVETIFITNKNAYKNKIYCKPTKLRLGYGLDEGEYVLEIKKIIFGKPIHITLEEAEDMVKILKEANANLNRQEVKK